MKLRLSDIYELQMGKTPARNTPAFWNGTNAWVSISDLTSSRKYISQTRECITDNAITRTGIKKIPKDTLLMSFKLSLGKVAITTTDIYTNEAIMAFIDKKKYDVDIHNRIFLSLHFSPYISRLFILSILLILPILRLFSFFGGQFGVIFNVHGLHFSRYGVPYWGFFYDAPTAYSINLFRVCASNTWTGTRLVLYPCFDTAMF